METSEIVGCDSGGRTRRSVGRRRATTAAEYLALVALVGAFLWRGLVPAWKTLNTDFPDYYLAARLYHQGYPLDQIYDWTWVQRQKDHAGIDRPIVAYTLLTPFSLLPVLPFSSLPPLPAKRWWLLVNLALLGLTGYLLHRMSKLGVRRVALLMFLAVIPLRSNFLYGQEYVLLLFLFTLAAWFYLRSQAVASGITLAVAAALKIYPGLVVILFLRKRQWRAAGSLLAGSAALWLLSIGLFGWQTVRTYLFEVLPWPLRAEGQDPYNPTWNSVSALLHRLFVAEPDLNPHPLFHLPAAYAVMQPVCQGLIFVPFLWLMTSSRSGAQREKLEWGVFIAMLLFLSTNPGTYDFNALILTAVFAVDYLMSAGRRRAAAVTVALYALVCFPIYRWVPNAPTGWRTFLALPRLWAMTALWICLVAVSSRASSRGLMGRLRSREAATFGAIWLALVALGATLNLRHQRREFQNYGARIAARGPALATDPVVAGETVLFTAMTRDGYATESLRPGLPAALAFPSDSFHPATVPGGEMGWVERVSTQSRIIRFLLGAATPAADGVVEAQDAEKPAVSSDGKWLAYIRESKGRGVLWVKPLSARVPVRFDWEKQLSPDTLDVLDLTFDTADDVIFSARHDGPPVLFTVDPRIGGAVPLGSSAPRRFPAASPDGRWLTYSEREGSNWQLWVQDLVTHAERQLTDSDCNSIAPAWYPDSQHLVYATDCGRGYGLTALCRIKAVP